jgi:hypothetical protein
LPYSFLGSAAAAFSSLAFLAHLGQSAAQHLAPFWMTNNPLPIDGFLGCYVFCYVFRHFLARKSRKSLIIKGNG